MRRGAEGALSRNSRTIESKRKSRLLRGQR